ncbi:MAG: hypothetical protein LKH29_07485 [Eggerthellaceae bacterium]|jgi:hypothetical protein|nr:hypothetical protein [Eggerthellaceae bacterium]
MDTDESVRALACELEAVQRELDELSRTLETMERQAALVAVEYEARVGRWERRRAEAARRFSRARARAMGEAEAGALAKGDVAEEAQPLPARPGDAWSRWREPAPTAGATGPAVGPCDYVEMQARLVLARAGAGVMRDRIAALRSQAPFCYREWLSDEAAVREKVERLRNDIASFETAAEVYERKNL